MKIKDAILPLLTSDIPARTVDASMSVMEALPLLLDTTDRRLAVSSDGTLVGIVTEGSMLDALGRFIAPRDDSSVITIECTPDQYSASAIANAVEDAGAHLVDLISGPTDHDTLRVTLRVRTLRPEYVMQNLERHGYAVTEAGAHITPDNEVFAERVAALNALLNV